MKSVISILVLFNFLIFHVKAETNLNSELFKAIQNHNLKKMVECIEKGADIHQVYKNNNGLLHYATHNGFYQGVKVLIDLGININHLNQFKEHALFAAITKKDLKIMELLIEKGSSLNSEGRPKLLISQTWYNDFKKGADLLIRNNININEKNDFQQNALFDAVRMNNLEMMDFLIKNGIDIHSEDKNGNALRYAIRIEFIEGAKMLLENKVSTDVKSDANYSLLMLAIKARDLELMKLLIKHGADVNFTNVHKKTALHYASYQNYTEGVRLLLESGADVNKTDQNQQTPLFHAVDSKSFDTMELLIKKGVLVNLKKEDGNTALQQAVFYDFYKGALLLIKNGADVNSKDNYQKTALFTAIKNQNIQMMELLIEQGADLFVRKHSGETPLEYAKKKDFKRGVQILSVRLSPHEKNNQTLLKINRIRQRAKAKLK